MLANISKALAILLQPYDSYSPRLSHGQRSSSTGLLAISQHDRIKPNSFMNTIVVIILRSTLKRALWIEKLLSENTIARGRISQPVPRCWRFPRVLIVPSTKAESYCLNGSPVDCVVTRGWRAAWAEGWRGCWELFNYVGRPTLAQMQITISGFNQRFSIPLFLYKAISNSSDLFRPPFSIVLICIHILHFL